MASKRSLRPPIHRLNAVEHRLDLRGKQFVGVLGVVSGGKKSLQFSNRAEAERKADEIQAMLQKHGAERLKVMNRMLGEDLNDLQAKLAPYNRTLTDAVNHYVSHLADERLREASETVGILVDRWLEEKKLELKKGMLRQRTIQTIGFYGERFKKEWGNRRVGTLTHHEIKTWLNSLTIGLGDRAVGQPSSMYEKHHHSHLSQFFRWCRKKYGTPRDNPCERIETQGVTAEPEFFSVEECEKILKLSLTDQFVDLLPFHAICIFAGVRVKECERLTWQEIDFEDGCVVLMKGTAKTRIGRRPEILPTLGVWLNWFGENHPKQGLIPVDFERKVKLFRREFGTWKGNAMRHSFASYYLSGIRKDFVALEANMGNSRSILQKYYVRFPSKIEAAKFWGLTPEKLMRDEKAQPSTAVSSSPALKV